ncbi:MAG TPA: hypothetical protein VN672_07695 [Solirubrobacteraceae bacterium]|nr:hypothetical protein [Solirubrobacteraceae bacterium]
MLAAGALVVLLLPFRTPAVEEPEGELAPERVLAPAGAAVRTVPAGALSARAGIASGLRRERPLGAGTLTAGGQAPVVVGRDT